MDDVRPSHLTLSDLIERTVSGWPPLTQQQRDDLASLLRGADTDD